MKSRQDKILDLINNKMISTQEELARELSNAGFSFTQATVSRDIKELGIIKAVDKNGVYRYAVPQENAYQNRFLNIFKESVVSIERANNLIVIKTYSGSAGAVGLTIDKFNLKNLLGCVSGDDTILAVASDNKAAEIIVSELKKLC